MANIIMYSTPTCPYCVRAKRLLNDKALEFRDIDVSTNPELRQKMQKLSGRYTVPQIFINDKAIGGCDELYQLESTHSLDVLLN